VAPLAGAIFPALAIAEFLGEEADSDGGLPRSATLIQVNSRLRRSR
jgi:hypothetical protein